VTIKIDEAVSRLMAAARAANLNGNENLGTAEIKKSTVSQAAKAVLGRTASDAGNSTGGLALSNYDRWLNRYRDAFATYDTTPDGLLSTNELLQVPQRQKTLFDKLNSFILDESGVAARLSPSDVTKQGVADGPMGDRFLELVSTLASSASETLVAKFEPRAKLTSADAAAVHNALSQPEPSEAAPKRIRQVSLENLRATLRDDFLGNSYSALEHALDGLMAQVQAERHEVPQLFLQNRGETVGARLIVAVPTQGVAYHLDVAAAR
jgi:hypothetical protein